MSSETILAELDREQRLAATAGNNVVVAAGAGSGKTKVLAARYAWLVMERKIPVDRILTLTFTNKAVSEMYSRIDGLLAAERDSPEARRAVAGFHLARISTLDSFCGQIARTAARRYGISPDFSGDEQAVRNLALEAGLPFVLEHRDNPSLQMLLSTRKIRTVAEELFAETVLRHSPVSKPLDFSRFIRVQNEELLRAWRERTAAASALVNAAGEALGLVTKTSSVLYNNLRKIFQDGVPPVPGIGPLLMAGGGEEALRSEVAAYFKFLDALRSVSLRGKIPDELAPVAEIVKELRENLYGELESIANRALQSGVSAAVFPLVEEFQARFNRRKREAGVLTFNDIARLAVDALADHPDIRRVYKESCDAVMIDEFQDNNGLQRDLVFLLAEQPGRETPGIPRPVDLSPDRMFFVGDEKQSIYRFRGADVSVFRRLAGDLAEAAGPGAPDGCALSLIHNYRSRPALIEAFNRIFGGSGPGYPGVFPPGSPAPADFEAVYSRLHPGEEADPGETGKPPVHFCFLHRGAPEGKESRDLDHEDLEAAFIAAKIREMVDRGFGVRVREGGKTLIRPCAYGDFAVLQRSYGRQGRLEKYCKLFGIPFTADRPAGLFNDAPVNDLYHLLRLLAYPGDRLSYAALIRSPFARLSDRTLTVCLLNGTDPATGLPRPPFDGALDDEVPPEEREQYRNARRRFQALAEEARTLRVTELLTRLWYGSGYRYETLWSAPVQIYGELFDLFFEIARKAGGPGMGLPDFVDHLAALIEKEEQGSDLDIPPEEETGVRLMSIHKSKGLEFPVVFVSGCGHRGASQTNNETVFFSEEWGITLNLPQADELPGKGGNYFFNRWRETEQARARAELRRLLYVAMTRAESALFVTAALPAQTKAEAEALPGGGAGDPADFIRARLEQLAARGKEEAQSFLDLLVPVISGLENPPFTVEAIPALSRDDLRRLAARSGAGSAPTPSMAEAADRAAPRYAAVEPAPAPVPRASPVSASRLRRPLPGAAPPGAGEASPPSEDTGLDRLLKQGGLEAADFGTIVHAFIEGRYKNLPPQIPPRLLAKTGEALWPALAGEARAMTERFFASDLGRLSLEAPYRETEFSFLTMLDRGDTKLPVNGRIDLLFESAGTMYVTDFKTDRTERPAEHLPQLAVYARAVSGIFDKPVRCRLFYLRSGRDLDMTDSAARIPLETLEEVPDPEPPDPTGRS